MQHRDAQDRAELSHRPRAVLVASMFAIVVLSSVGCRMRDVTRNPLADPLLGQHVSVRDVLLVKEVGDDRSWFEREQLNYIAYHYGVEADDVYFMTVVASPRDESTDEKPEPGIKRVPAGSTLTVERAFFHNLWPMGAMLYLYGEALPIAEASSVPVTLLFNPDQLAYSRVLLPWESIDQHGRWLMPDIQRSLGNVRMYQHEVELIFGARQVRLLTESGEAPPVLPSEDVARAEGGLAEALQDALDEVLPREDVADAPTDGAR